MKLSKYAYVNHYHNKYLVYSALTGAIVCLEESEYDSIEPIISNTVSKLGNINGFIHSAGIEAILPLTILKQEMIVPQMRKSELAVRYFNNTINLSGYISFNAF